MTDEKSTSAPAIGKLYVWTVTESYNGTVVGAFSSKELADAWITSHEDAFGPPEDPAYYTIAKLTLDEPAEPERETETIDETIQSMIDSGLVKVG